MKYWREIAIIVMGVALAMTLKKCNTESAIKNSVFDRMSALTDTITTYKDKNGTLHAEKRSAQLTIGELESLKMKQLEHIKNLRNLNSLSIVSTSTSDTIKIPTTDTLVNNRWMKKFEWKDKWSLIQGIVDSGHVDLAYYFTDSVSITTHWKRPGFLKKKELYIDATNSNPRSKIEGMNNINVYNKPAMTYGWGFTIGYGVTLPDFEPKPAVLAGFQIRF